MSGGSTTRRSPRRAGNGGGAGPISAWWPVAAWATGILVATTVPDPGVAGTAGGPVDKIVHGVMYFGLGATIVRALRLSGRSTRGTLVLAFLAATAFAGLDEWHQGWVGRDPELADWIADAVGLTAGIGLLGFWMRRRDSGRGYERDRDGSEKEPRGADDESRRAQSDSGQSEDRAG